VLVNLLLFDLAVLVGAWVVHQTEYLIEYGDRFNTVMASTPHRSYMTAAAVVMAMCMVLACGVLSVVSVSRVRRTRAATARLSPRIARRLERLTAPLPVGMVSRIAVAVFVCQCGFYTVQENLEAWMAGAGFPGAAVLIGVQHITVLPLHALVALISAILLGTVASRSERARVLAHVTGALAALLARRSSALLASVCPRVVRGSGRIACGPTGLRAPPAFA
jgi:hypothetical protein